MFYNALAAIFGVALWQAFDARADRPAQRAGRVAGSLLVLIGVLGAVMTLWFPMDPIGSETTPAGIGHVALAGLISVASMATTVSTGLAFSRSRRWSGYGPYSSLSVVAVFVRLSHRRHGRVECGDCLGVDGPDLRTSFDGWLYSYANVHGHGMRSTRLLGSFRS